MKRPEKILIGVAIIIVIVVAWLILKGKSAAQATVPPPLFPLKYGDKNVKVLIAQQKLNAVDPTIQLLENGQLGPDTKSALLRYATYPLTQDSYNQLLLMA